MSQFSTKPVPTPTDETTASGTTTTSPFRVVMEVEVPVPFQALADLVRSLDADEIQAIALAKLSWGDDRNLTRYILETIALALEAFDAH